MTPTYGSWRAMVDRCTGPRHVAFGRYGGRGIKICERWRTFVYFLADMGKRPCGMELDRIDNDGDYEPANCRWASRLTQMRHLRRLEPHEPDQIRWLLSLGYSKVEIGRHFDVSHATVRGIGRGTRYAA